MKPRQKQTGFSTENKGFGTLGSLLSNLDLPVLPDAPTPMAPTVSEPAPASSSSPALFRPVFHIERKGHGGKTVTVFEAQSLTEEQRSQLCRRLSSALGCGCRTEGTKIVIQGDNRERAGRFFEKESGK